MASGTGDRVDVTSWIPSVRSSSAPRSGWEAAGVAARTGDSSQDRFGEALTAARARDEAAATRSREAASQERDGAARAASARTRQAAIRDGIRDAGRAEERQPSAAGDATRASSANRADGTAKTSGPDGGAPGATAAAAGTGSAESAARDPVGGGAAAAADAPRGDRAHTPSTEGDASEASKAEAAKTGNAKAEDPKAETAKAGTAGGEGAPQAAAQNVPTTLLTLLAALAKGTPVAVAEGAGVEGVATAPAGTATVSGSAPAGTAGAAQAAGTGAAPASGVEAGASSDRVAATQSGRVGAVDTPAAPATDFLTALTDAGQNAPVIHADAAARAGAPDAAVGAATASVAASPAAAQATTAAAPQPAAPATPAVPIGQVPMTIGLRSLAGSSEFQIRLDPAELGRIEVKLEIDKSRGTVMTHLVVDRADTLAMLQRDSGQLQQALAQTGLDPSGGGINLSLRGDGSAQGDARGGQGDAPRGGTAPWTADTPEAQPEGAPLRRLRGYGGVDIRI